MTVEQQEFLRLNIICGINFQGVADRMNISKTQVSKWYEELKVEREEIAKIRTVWTTKKFTENFEEFYNWYINLERKCEYCGITEAEIKSLLDSQKLSTKRIATRGRKLEFDRKEPELAYNQLNNIVLCCYWCNNAKTDTFTYKEFKKVGKVIAEIWKDRVLK